MEEREGTKKGREAEGNIEERERGMAERIGG